MIEENGYSLVKINNADYKPLKIVLRECMSTMITTQHLIDIERNYIYTTFICSNVAHIILSGHFFILNGINYAIKI